MKALTVQQPWAWAIAHGFKRIENRAWETPYRGLLAIHAGRNREMYAPYFGKRLRREKITLPAAEDIPFGCIVAVARLVDVVPLRLVRREPFAEGPWCWILRDIQRVAPFSCNGYQGLWETPVGFDLTIKQT